MLPNAATVAANACFRQQVTTDEVAQTLERMVSLRKKHKKASPVG